MIESLRLILHIVASLFTPRAKLVAEMLVLRQQLNVLRRQVSKRPQLSNTARLLFVWLYRWFPSVLSAIAILRPQSGFRAKSPRRFRGTVHLVILFGTGTRPMARSSSSGCTPWAFGTSQPLPDRRGRTHMSRD